jgi:hypothetical protein
MLLTLRLCGASRAESEPPNGTSREALGHGGAERAEEETNDAAIAHTLTHPGIFVLSVGFEGLKDESLRASLLRVALDTLRARGVKVLSAGDPGADKGLALSFSVSVAKLEGVLLVSHREAAEMAELPTSLSCGEMGMTGRG